PLRGPPPPQLARPQEQATGLIPARRVALIDLAQPPRLDDRRGDRRRLLGGYGSLLDRHGLLPLRPYPAAGSAAPEADRGSRCARARSGVTGACLLSSVCDI